MSSASFLLYNTGHTSNCNWRSWQGTSCTMPKSKKKQCTEKWHFFFWNIAAEMGLPKFFDLNRTALDAI